MIVAAWLALYSVAILVVGPPLLRRLTQACHAPRFAIAVWLTTMTSVLVCWPTAALLVAFEFGKHTAGPGGVVVSCVETMRSIAAGEAGLLAQAVAWLVVAVAVAAPTVMVARMVITLRRMRDHAHQHASAVRLVGRSRHEALGFGGHEADVVVMPAAEPVAYCVEGRPSAIVVTTAAIEALRRDQLAAVLAHERAHLVGHHAVLVGILRALAAALPRLTLFTLGAEQVSTLLEMRADDVASRRHGPSALLGGLLALSGATPSPALAAAGCDVVARAQRLAADTADRPGARAQALLGTVIMLTTASPMSIAALSIIGVLLCTP